jgi:glutamine---fructose-6-phosphate transaminase (isomerizing)
MIPLEEARKGHPYFMHEMILEQPNALHATLELCKREAPDITPFWEGVNKVVTTGCGTSYHAALAAANILYALFERTNIEAVQSLELKHYYNVLDSKTLAIGFSHSGTTKTTTDAVSRAASRGARTIGLTGTAGSNLTKISTRHLVVGNGVEKSRAHTKSYTSSMLAAIYLGAAYLRAEVSETSVESFLDHINEVPEYIHSAINQNEKQVAELSSTDGAKAKKIFIVGAGPNVATALEGALKLKETSYIAAEGMETEQFLHGPWVSLDKDAIVILLAPQGPSRERSIDLLRALKNLDVKVVAITDDKRIVEQASESIFIPEVKEELTPLVYVVPLQLFAYYLAVKKGNNPDFIHYDDPKFWASRMIIFPPGTH